MLDLISWKVLAVVTVLLSPNINGDRETEQYWSNDSFPTLEACEAARVSPRFVVATELLTMEEIEEHAPLTVFVDTECRIKE